MRICSRDMKLALMHIERKSFARQECVFTDYKVCLLVLAYFLDMTRKYPQHILLKHLQGSLRDGALRGGYEDTQLTFALNCEILRMTC